VPRSVDGRTYGSLSNAIGLTAAVTSERDNCRAPEGQGSTALRNRADATCSGDGHSNALTQTSPFGPETLMKEDHGIGLAGECRLCQALVRRGNEHHRACSRRRLTGSLAEAAPDLAPSYSSPNVGSSADGRSGETATSGKMRPSRS
jgi:hypothetical protein